MTDEALIARIVRLEKGNRRLAAWLFVVSIGAVLLITCMPFSIVRNPLGGPRIAMTAFGQTSVLNFWNTGGKSRLELGATPGGATINVLGREGKPRLAFYTIEEGDRDTPVLLMYDPTNPQGAAKLELTKEGRPELVMKPSLGKGAIYLTFLPGGDPVLRLVGKDGTVIFESPHPVDAATPPVEAER